MTKTELTCAGSPGPSRSRCFLPALFAPLLCLVVACTAEPVDGDEEVGIEVQASCVPRRGVGCWILRPVGWNVLGVGCVEGPDTTIFRGDGQTYTAFAVPTILFGSGSTTLLCDGGCLKTQSASCRKSGIEP